MQCATVLVDVDLDSPHTTPCTLHAAVLVAWRNRWATAIRLLAPLLFLALALIVQVVMAANTRRTGRIRDTPFSSLSDISSIPDCSDELFIFNKPCLDFVYTPNNDTTVKVTKLLAVVPSVSAPVVSS
jgi:hypothetical protein